MTLIDAAAQLGLTAATLRQQIANGKLRAKKIGRDWTVTAREVERYRAESRRMHRPEPDGPNWWTVRHNGAWRSGCKHCDRVVAYVPRTDSWRHTR